MCDLCHPEEITKQVIDRRYPPKKIKGPSMEWADIEYVEAPIY
jgi:hypothetical protein